jgi:inorganic triphosphatase YgiF
VNAPDHDTEIEVKLGVVDPEPVRRLLEAPDRERLAGFQSAGPLHTVVVVDRYLDTARGVGRLAGQAMRARLRTSRDEVTLTVKRSGIEGDLGVTTRMELEGPATRDIEPRAWPASPAREALLAAADGLPLRQIAALRQSRLVRRFRRADTVVEISLDDLEALHAGEVVGRRHELEAELIEGDRGLLDGLAAALSQLDGVTEPIGSKLAFALGASWPEAASESPPDPASDPVR